MPKMVSVDMGFIFPKFVLAIGQFSKLPFEYNVSENLNFSKQNFNPETEIVLNAI